MKTPNKKIKDQFYTILKQIETAQVDLDRRKNAWARDYRAEFAPGKPGDIAFVSSLVGDFKMKPKEGDSYLVRAVAGLVESDALRKAGGIGELYRMSDTMSTDQMAKVLKEAVTKRTKIDFLRTDKPSPKKTGPSKDDDLQAFAIFVAQSKDAPASLKKRALVYVPPALAVKLNQKRARA